MFHFFVTVLYSCVANFGDLEAQTFGIAIHLLYTESVPQALRMLI